MRQSLLSSCPSLDSFQYVSVLLCTQGIQDWSGKRKGSPPFICCNALPNTAQDTSVLSLPQVHILSAWFACPPGSAGHQCFSAKRISSWFVSSLWWWMRLFLPRCRALHFPLLEIMRSLLTYFSSLPRSLWKAAQPFSVSITLILHHPQTCCVCILPLYPDLKMLNSFSSSIQSRRTQIVTTLQQDFMLLSFDPSSSASLQSTSLSVYVFQTSSVCLCRYYGRQCWKSY